MSSSDNSSRSVNSLDQDQDDTLMAFLKYFLKTLILKNKNQQTTQMQNYPACKDSYGDASRKANYRSIISLINGTQLHFQEISHNRDQYWDIFV